MKHGTLARLLAAVALILTALIGPLAPARAARVADPTVTITVWTSYTQGLLKIFDTMVASFEKQYPSIKVVSITANDYNTLLQKEQSAIFAGNPPTVGQAYESWVEQFTTKNNAVEDLGPYINGKNGLTAADIKDFYTSVWNDGMLNGKHYMMPFSKSDTVLYYNPTLLAKSGISKPPKTWAEFAADCVKLTKMSNGRPTQWGSTFQVDEALWYAWEDEWGNQVLNSANKPAFATVKGAAPVKFFADLAKKKAIVISNSQNYQDQTDFDAGKTAFDIGTSAGLSYVLGGAKPGVQVEIARLPAGPVRQATEMYGAPLVIFSKATAAQKQAAWTFLKWATEPAQTASWSMQSGYLPVRRSALTISALQAYYKKYPTRRAAVDQLNNAVIEPSLVGWAKAQSDIQAILLPALSGSKDPLAAMKEAATEVTADLSRQ